VRRVSTALALVLAAALVVVTAGCSGDGGSDAAPTGSKSRSALTMRLTSPAFADNGTIPTRFTCAGAGTRPDLHWSAPPAGTRELALLVFDPDAGDRGFVHWLVFGIDPSRRAATSNQYPGGAPGMNGTGNEGWVPPCPPSGGPHHYVFTVFALSRSPELAPTANVDQFLDASKGSVLARGELTGTYGR
jgi:Raf kinase inhibitor-like YbhB/YbcL family protein